MAPVYKSITGLAGNEIMSVSISQSHNSPIAIATIESRVLNHSLGDHIHIDIGYVGSHKQMFQGYIKSIEHSIPDNTYTISANNDLIRAQDDFIVSANPEEPLTYQNITGETLVTTLMALAGLTDVVHDDTSFTFGVSNAFEVNQVSVYDFCKSVADLLTYAIWCDENGQIHFENRKPFLMTGSEPQPGWTDDVAIAYVWSDTKTLNITKTEDESDLRNRVVVYGSTGVQAEAQDAGSPYFHYKTAVLADAGMIEDNAMAQDIADYNLHLFNKITSSVSATVTGDVSLLPFTAVHVESTKMAINEDYYIYSTTHTINRSGYLTQLELRK